MDIEKIEKALAELERICLEYEIGFCINKAEGEVIVTISDMDFSLDSADPGKDTAKVFAEIARNL